MATLEAADAVRTGLDLVGDAEAADEDGDEFRNTGRELLFVANGGESSIDVTFETTTTVDGQAVADRTVAVPAGESRLIGHFPTGIYNDGAGNVSVTYSDVTDVTVLVVRVGP